MSKFRQKAQELRHAQDLAAAIASPREAPGAPPLHAEPTVGSATSGARSLPGASPGPAFSSLWPLDGADRETNAIREGPAREPVLSSNFAGVAVLREAPLRQLAEKCEDLRLALDACSKQLVERDRACCAAEARVVMLERERGALLDRQLEQEKRLAEFEAGAYVAAARAAPSSADPSLPRSPCCRDADQGLQQDSTRRIAAEDALVTACRQRDEAQARVELLEQSQRVTLPAGQPCPCCQSLGRSLLPDEAAKRKAADDAIALACRQRDDATAKVVGNLRGTDWAGSRDADAALAQAAELQSRCRGEAQELAQQRARTQELQEELARETARREQTERCLSEGQQHFTKMATEAASSAEQGATRHAAVLSELEGAFRRLAAEEELRRGVEADLAAAECELAARRAAQDLKREASGSVATEALAEDSPRLEPAEETHPCDNSCPSRDSTGDRSAMVESLRKKLDTDENGHLVMRQESVASCRTVSPRPARTTARDAEMLHAELDVLLARLEDAQLGGSSACSPRKISEADAVATDTQAAVESEVTALQRRLEDREREHTEAQDHLNCLLNGARQENRSLAGELRAAKAVAASAIAESAVAKAESEMNPFTRQRATLPLPRNSAEPSLANPNLAQREVARPRRDVLGDERPRGQRSLGDVIEGRNGGGGGDLAGGLPPAWREEVSCAPWPAVPRFQPKTPPERSLGRDTGIVSQRAPSPRQEQGLQTYRGPCVQHVDAPAEFSDFGSVASGSRRVTWL